MANTMDFEGVRRLLPQAHPFLMVDRVTEFESGKSIVAVKNVTGNEAFFQGHFPGMAIMPAALILEGLAQAAILLTKKSSPGDAGLYVFGSVHARMTKPVVPGDVLHLAVKLLKLYGDGGAAEGRATVDGATCVEAEMYFSKLRLTR